MARAQLSARRIPVAVHQKTKAVKVDRVALFFASESFLRRCRRNRRDCDSFGQGVRHTVDITGLASGRTRSFLF